MQKQAQAQKDGKAQFNGVKVFSATMRDERENLGETVTQWIRTHPTFYLVDTIVTQSSDAEFHCIVITVFYWQPGVRR